MRFTEPLITKCSWTSGNSYIKEFVHGDFGRTKPNLCQLLNTDTDILELDVEVGWENKTRILDYRSFRNVLLSLIDYVPKQLTTILNVSCLCVIPPSVCGCGLASVHTRVNWWQRRLISLSSTPNPQPGSECLRLKTNSVEAGWRWNMKSSHTVLLLLLLLCGLSMF